MGIRDFARSLRPGNDQQLAASLSRQNRRGHRRSIPGTARASQAWEDADRADERNRRGTWSQ
ncbi:hypothetical protein ABZ330_00330 [Streptomyces sp. NPDC006172]|uniref:hypothetical protein n=1 Tax=Streptomyces sp. NPDC006172 TaxID=3154470 RepID=UPI0033CEB61E